MATRSDHDQVRAMPLGENVQGVAYRVIRARNQFCLRRDQLPLALKQPSRPLELRAEQQRRPFPGPQSGAEYVHEPRARVLVREPGGQGDRISTTLLSVHSDQDLC